MVHLLTFQQLRTDIHKLHLLPQVSLVKLPDAGDEGVFFCCAAGYPPVHLLKVKVKLRIFLNEKSKRVYQPWMREKGNIYANFNKVMSETLTHWFPDLASIFGINFHEISELPCLLSLVKIPFVRFLNLHHFNLDRSFCCDWRRKRTEFQTHRPLFYITWV